MLRGWLQNHKILDELYKEWEITRCFHFLKAQVVFVLVQKLVVARVLLGCSGLWLAGNRKANRFMIFWSLGLGATFSAMWKNNITPFHNKPHNEVSVAEMCETVKCWSSGLV